MAELAPVAPVVLEQAAQNPAAVDAVVAANGGGAAEKDAAKFLVAKAGKSKPVIPPSEGIKVAHRDLLTWLYANHGPLVDTQLATLEQYTGLKREQLTYALGGLWFVYMILGGGAQFVSNLIGFAYPAYASVKAVRTEGKDDDSQWLMYWTVFAGFFLVDSLMSGVVSWFPFYFFLKSIFLVFLYLPQTMGAEYLYETVVDPGVTFIDACIQKYF